MTAKAGPPLLSANSELGLFQHHPALFPSRMAVRVNISLHGFKKEKPTNGESNRLSLKNKQKSQFNCEGQKLVTPKMTAHTG